MYLHVQRIRDFVGNALYKFTFYLLTYLHKQGHVIKIGLLRCSYAQSLSSFTIQKDSTERIEKRKLNLTTINI